MARIEGTGIKEPSKEAKVANLNFLRNPKKFLQQKVDQKLDSMTKSGKTPFGTSIGGSAVGEEGLGRFGNPNELSDASNEIKNRTNFFSPGGGAFDERNDVQVASAGDFSGTSDESDFQGYMKALGIRKPKTLPSMTIRMLKQNYQDDVRDGRYKEGQLINQAPVKEKPSFVEQTKNLAGSVFNAITGTQPAAASQIPGGMPTGTQFTSSNLDAARAPVGSVTTGDTSFSSFRMAGGGQQQQQDSGIVTPFSQTSMGKGEGRKVTPFSETSMGQRVSVAPTTAPKTVTIDGQTVAARQTVASLPSDYKQTEAREFAKAAAFKEAQGIAKRNPNVKVGVDSKGQPKATAANDTGRARAQAAAVNRKLSGKSISQTKAANRASMRASAAARNASFQARKKAGTLSRSERTASGQRAAKKAAARKRAQSAAKARKAKKNQSRRRRSTRGRRGRRGGRR